MNTTNPNSTQSQTARMLAKFISNPRVELDAFALACAASATGFPVLSFSKRLSDARKECESRQLGTIAKTKDVRKNGARQTGYTYYPSELL